MCMCVCLSCVSVCTYLKVFVLVVCVRPHVCAYMRARARACVCVLYVCVCVPPQVFRTTKVWCYRITTLLFAVPATVLCGIYSALLACCSIWCCRPCIRAFQIELQCFKGFYMACINTFIRPCYEAVGFCCYNFRIVINKGGDPAGQSSV